MRATFNNAVLLLSNVACMYLVASHAADHPDAWGPLAMALLVGVSVGTVVTTEIHKNYAKP